MVSIVRNTQWPFAGDRVTLTATGMTGNRARFALLSKPPASVLELYDSDAQAPYLAGTEKTADITPDVDGTYSIGVGDFTVSANPPNYNGDGSTGASIGIETVSTNATANYVLRVGRVMQRQIGFAPNACTVTVKAHGDSALSTTSGIMTYKAGASYAPTLTGATTDAAKQALRASAVTAQMAAFGASGYAGTSALVSWSTLLGTSDILKHMSWLGLRLDSHIASPFWPVHRLRDTATASTVSTAAIGTNLASCITRLNDCRIAQLNHYTDTVSHSVTATAGVPAVLGGGSFASAATQVRLLAAAHNTHTSTTWTALGTESYVHYPPGAAWQTVVTSSVANTGALATRTRTLCQGHTRHVLRYWSTGASNIVNLGYHLGGTATGTATAARTNEWGTAGNRVGYFPATYADVPRFVNDCLDVLGAHAGNKTMAGVVTNAHGVADAAAKTDDIPRASDQESAVLAFEALEKRFLAHISREAVSYTTQVHATLNAASGATHANAAWQYTLDGLSLLHSTYTDALVDTAATVPPNENLAASKLVKLGGFRKV